jgi:hypothetical protein
MYPENKYSEASAIEMTYQNQLNQLHQIADKLFSKVAHISSEELRSGSSPTPSHSTRLNREIQEVITRFEDIVDNIIN